MGEIRNKINDIEVKNTNDRSFSLLSVNALNSSVKRQKIAECIKNAKQLYVI